MKTKDTKANEMKLKVAKKSNMRNIFIRSIAAGTALISLAFTGCGKKEALSPGSITVLEPVSFVEKVRADGTVECSEPHYIYSNLTLPVQEIYVKEGDHVSEGDLLCKLDVRTIEEQIEIQQAAMELTQKNASSQEDAARRQYNIYSEGLKGGTDVNLVAAKAAMESAREVYETAKKRYDDYMESLNMGMDPALSAADQAVARAATALHQAKSMQYELDDEEHVTDIQKEEAEDAVDSASLAYVQAVESKKNLLRQSDITLADYAKNADDANLNYIIAQSAYNAAVRALENAKATTTDAINQAVLSGDMSVEDLKLAQLRQKLVDSNITSDFEGTVTAVNVEVGENSTGVLFVVEDTSDLILTARVPEKDINSISSDMAITVTPKADNSGSYKGVISRVADSSEKNASGKTDTSGEDAEYKVTIVIEDPDERIRIGMNADAEFTVFEQEGCFTVPKDAVYKDEEGSTSVLAVNTAEGSGTVIKTPVSVVYAGKSMNVIEGSGIASGTRVLTDASAGMELVGTRVNIGK